MADKYDLGGPPGAFQKVTFNLAIESKAPLEQIRRLIDHAERACHASQSFRAPVPTELKATVNGEEVAPAAEPG